MNGFDDASLLKSQGIYWRPDAIVKGGPGSGPRPGERRDNHARENATRAVANAAEHIRDKMARFAVKSPRGESYIGNVRHAAAARELDRIHDSLLATSNPEANNHMYLEDHIAQMQGDLAHGQANYGNLQSPADRETALGIHDGLRTALSLVTPKMADDEKFYTLDYAKAIFKGGPGSGPRPGQGLMESNAAYDARNMKHSDWIKGGQRTNSPIMTRSMDGETSIPIGAKFEPGGSHEIGFKADELSRAGDHAGAAAAYRDMATHFYGPDSPFGAGVEWHMAQDAAMAEDAVNGLGTLAKGGPGSGPHASENRNIVRHSVALHKAATQLAFDAKKGGDSVWRHSIAERHEALGVAHDQMAQAAWDAAKDPTISAARAGRLALLASAHSDAANAHYMAADLHNGIGIDNATRAPVRSNAAANRSGDAVYAARNLTEDS